jgi:F-type H+-transporting ATPase subunit a
MQISPDSSVFWQWNFVILNATLVFTWAIILFLGICFWLITRNLSSDIEIDHSQSFLEILVSNVREQIRQTSGQDPDIYLPFIGTLFVFIATSNILSVIPFFEPPTGSLSTTAALAICVFFSVPFYGISQQGIGKYLSQYLKPNPIMLPFHIISELSRTLALSVRLFGNVMSAGMIAGLFGAYFLEK